MNLYPSDTPLPCSHIWAWITGPSGHRRLRCEICAALMPFVDIPADDGGYYRVPLLPDTDRALAAEREQGLGGTSTGRRWEEAEDWDEELRRTPLGSV